MNNLKIKNIIFSVSGAVLIVAGLVLAIYYTVPQGVMPALPYVLGGYGIFALFAGINGMLVERMKKKDSNLAKEINDYNDERSASIELKTKAAINDFTTVLFLAFIVFLAVMQVHLAVLLAFVGAFFVRMFVSFYLVHKYNKEM